MFLNNIAFIFKDAVICLESSNTKMERIHYFNNHLPCKEKAVKAFVHLT